MYDHSIKVIKKFCSLHVCSTLTSVYFLRYRKRFLCLYQVIEAQKWKIGRMRKDTRTDEILVSHFFGREQDSLEKKKMTKALFLDEVNHRWILA